jgi:hypothetical protein
LASESPEEARELHAALVKEEVKLQEVQLEARKVAALEQQVKLQALRIEVDMEKVRSQRGMKAAEVVDSKPLPGAAAALAEKSAVEIPAGQEPGDPMEKQKLLLVLREVNEKKADAAVVTAPASIGGGKTTPRSMTLGASYESKLEAAKNSCVGGCVRKVVEGHIAD